MNPCKKCKPPKEIKDTFGCCGDRLHNAWEDVKCEFLKSFKDKYIPEYQCRYADLIDHTTEKGGEQMKKLFKNILKKFKRKKAFDAYVAVATRELNRRGMYK